MRSRIAFGASSRRAGRWKVLTDNIKEYREVLREVLTQLANTVCDEGAIDERESLRVSLMQALPPRRAAGTMWASRNAGRA